MKAFANSLTDEQLSARVRWANEGGNGFVMELTTFGEAHYDTGDNGLTPAHTVEPAAMLHHMTPVIKEGDPLIGLV